MIEEKELRKARQRVGWFVILGITLVISLLLIMSIRTDLFAKKFSLYVAPSSAASFHIGQAVKFHGYRVGSVQHIELQKTGAVKVQLRILEKYHTMLSPDVRARSTKEGLIGELSLELISGEIHDKHIQAGKEIPYEPEATIEKFLQDIKPAVHNADTLLQQMASLSTWLNDPKGDIRTSMKHMRHFSERLQHLEIENLTSELQQVAHQLKQLSQQMVNEKSIFHLNQVLVQAEKNLLQLEPITHRLETTGPKAVDQSVHILDQVTQLLTRLQAISSDVAAATPQLPHVVQDSAKTIHDMKNMAQRLRTSWLFSDDQPTQTASPHTEPILDFQP